MRFFKPKLRGQLGVDIGASNLKIVETTRDDHGYKLLTFGSVGLKQSVIRASGPKVEAEIADTLKNLAAQANVQTKKVVAGIPGFAVFTAIIDLPYLEDSEFDFAIQSEAKRYVPAPLNEVVLDWRKVEEIQIPGSKLPGTRILLTAASRDYVNKYISIFAKAGYELEALEIDSFAIARALLDPPQVTAMIIDMGSAATDINIFSNGSLFINRNVDRGGQSITAVVAQSLNVDLVRAEQFKRDLDLTNLATTEEALPKAIKPTIDIILSEVSRIHQAFNQRYLRSIEKVILTGGCSKLRGIDHYISEVLGMPVEVGNPFQKMTYPEQYVQTLIDIAPNFGVAAGLALRSPDEK